VPRSRNAWSYTSTPILLRGVVLIKKSTGTLPLLGTASRNSGSLLSIPLLQIERQSGSWTQSLHIYKANNKNKQEYLTATCAKRLKKRILHKAELRYLHKWVQCM